MIDAAHDDWLTEGVLTRRVLAWLIDAVILAVLLLVLKVALIAFAVVTLGLGLPLLGLLLIVPFFYVAWFVAVRGATPGQSAMGIVVRCDGDLMPPTPLQAVIWTAGLFVTLAAGVVWLLFALVTVRHRTLHDLAAGVVVSRSRSLAPRTGIWTMPGSSGRPFV